MRWEAETVTGGWVQKGFHHVLPKGTDHMLFILGLFLLLPKWKPMMGQSLLFTLAHSITLAIAVLGVVHIPEKVLGIRQPVEVLIAVSIAWVGIENLLTRKLGKQRHNTLQEGLPKITTFSFSRSLGPGKKCWAVKAAMG